MKPSKEWNEQDFLNITGRPAKNDDLDRVNCDKAGQLCHTMCGVCKHNLPMFMCNDCIKELADQQFKQR